MVSRVGMTRWNLLSSCLAQMWIMRITVSDCHIQARSPSYCLPKVPVQRDGICMRLGVWLSRTWQPLRTLRCAFVTTMGDRTSRNWYWVKVWCIISPRSSRVLLARAARCLELISTWDMCRRVQACGQLAIGWQNYGMPHCWRTLRCLRIQSSGPSGWISRGRLCGTGTITIKAMAYTCTRIYVIPTAVQIPSRRFLLGAEGCWHCPLLNHNKRPRCCFKSMEMFWWWQASFNLSFGMVFQHAAAGRTWWLDPCSLKCRRGSSVVLKKKFRCMKLQWMVCSMCAWIARWGGTRHTGQAVQTMLRMSLGLNRFLLGLSGRLSVVQQGKLQVAARYLNLQQAAMWVLLGWSGQARMLRSVLLKIRSSLLVRLTWLLRRRCGFCWSWWTYLRMLTRFGGLLLACRWLVGGLMRNKSCLI